VVVVNKRDLVSEDQKADIIGKIVLLNPRAKVVESVHSKVNVMEILNTHLFNAEDNKVEFWMKSTQVEAEEKIESNVLNVVRSRWPKRARNVQEQVQRWKSGRLQLVSGILIKRQPSFDSFLQVQLDVVANNNIKDRKIT
jgi:G3E family GTPase